MNSILHISCDEAGHTGPDLLDKDQRHFAYASVAIDDQEAASIIAAARAAHPLQMPELKALRLIRTERGRRLIVEILEAMRGRYVVNVYDKLLALCGWFFEYIYEPVYQADPSLLYQKNFHRFVAMYTWLWMTDNESQARPAIEQFQRYMRTRDPADAAFLFYRPHPPPPLDGAEHPFETILRFAYGYRDAIIADNARIDTELPDQGRWTLDLSTSAIWSHLNCWGRTGKQLAVNCDASKPIQANVPILRGDDGDAGIRRARSFHPPEPLGWRLARPVDFVDSQSHHAIQLADVAAGAMIAVVRDGFPESLREIASELADHIHPHSILPDTDVIDPSTRSAAVNSLILFDLAKRAERNADPFYGLSEMYHYAEVGFARGDYGRSGWQRQS
jgi:hypothetical protein